MYNFGLMKEPAIFTITTDYLIWNNCSKVLLPTLGHENNLNFGISGTSQPITMLKSIKWQLSKTIIAIGLEGFFTHKQKKMLRNIFDKIIKF